MAEGALFMSFVALVLPWLVGALLLLPCWAAGRPGRIAAALGYGYLVGLALAMVPFWALQQRSGQWQQGVVLFGLAAVAAFLFLLQRRQLLAAAGYVLAAQRPHLTRFATMPLWQRLALALLFGLIGLSILLVGAEVWLRPVFPWDAWETWSHVAKTAYFHPDVITERWLAFRFEQSMVPLLQVWQAQALGNWHAALVNTPWLLAGAALLLALYGQLRYLGATALVSALATTALAVAPLYAVNSALAGYPELWTCCCYALAVMAACVWLRERRVGQGILAILTSVLVIFTDRYAAGFSVLLWCALVLAVVPWRWSLAALLLIALGVAWMVVAGVDVKLPKLGRLVLSTEQVILPKALAMTFSLAEAPWAAAASRLFADATWSVVWVTAAIAGLAACSRIYLRDAGLRFLLVLVPATTVLVMCMLLFSRLQASVVEGTGINRWLFPLLPVLVFWSALVLGRLPQRGAELESQSGVASPAISAG